jgi:hypothetical protein
MAGSAAGSAPSSAVPLSPNSQQETPEKSKSLKRRFEEQDEVCIGAFQSALIGETGRIQALTFCHNV